MLTSAECRARAEQKIAEAELQPRHERKLRTPAEGWLVLADPMERLEASMRVGEPESPRRGIFLGQPGLMTPPIFRASLIQQGQSHELAGVHRGAWRRGCMAARSMRFA